MYFVFDFGAVLFNWQPQRLLREQLPRVVHDEASAAHWVQQFFQGFGGDWGLFDRGDIDVDALALRIAARTGLTPDEVRQVVAAVPPHLQLLADSHALLQRLRAAGRPLYYLSNMPALYAQHLEAAHPLDEWFADGLFSARVRLSKPDAAIFALAQQRFGRAAHELVFLDDSPANIAAASAAGWRAQLFTDAAQAEAQLRQRGWWPPELA